MLQFFICYIFIIRFILIYFSSFSVQPILFCKIVGRSINTFVQTNSFVQQHHSSLVNIVNDLGSFVNKIFENSERNVFTFLRTIHFVRSSFFNFTEQHHHSQTFLFADFRLNPSFKPRKLMEFLS